MQGSVEIYAIKDDGSQELIFEGDNLIVDSGRETIVDLLTTKILPHEPSGYYDMQRFTPMFLAFGQVREVEVSGGAHITSSLDSSGTNYNTLSAYDLSSYTASPPKPTDTRTNEPESDFDVFPNYLNFSGQYTGTYTHDEMVSLGTYLPSAGTADGFPGNNYTLTHQACINSEGFIYPNSNTYETRSASTEAASLYGLQSLVAARGTLAEPNEVIYGLHMTGHDIGFLHTHYLGMQYMGLYTIDYFATRSKLGTYEFLTPGANNATPGQPQWVLDKDTNPVMKLFSKKSLISGPLMGLFSDFLNGPASVTLAALYDLKGVAIIWRVRF